MNTNRFSTFMQKKRLEKGLTQLTIAQKLNVSFQAVSKWENGTTFPNTDLLLSLSDLLDVTVDELLRGREIEKAPLTYSMAGVDLNFTDKLKEELEPHLSFNNPKLLSEFKNFSPLLDISTNNIDNPVLVLKSEDPGTKQKLALDYGYIDTICHDMINHLVNDVIVMGAKPMGVIDNIFCGFAEKQTIKSLVENISIACSNNDCLLIGGKTSILNGVIDRGAYLLSSTLVALVDKSKIINGSKIKEGDSIIGVSSNGLHTSGYSLVRLLMDEMPHIKRELVNGENFIESIMKPHLSYYKCLNTFSFKDKIKGMAHITSGGIEGNLRRIINDGLCAKIDLSKIDVLDIFKFIKDNGNVSQNEMLQTFNCGIGLIIIINEEYKDILLKHLNKFHKSYEIGTIIKGDKKVSFTNFINW